MRISNMSLWGCWVGLLGVLLVSCHDAPRENPFDPVLTPGVELQVTLDDTAGIATVNWTRYAGNQSFAEYRVLRNVARSIAVDDDGYIYVADVGNRRIQKFAP